MVCATCQKAILTGRYRARIKTSKGDWGWVTQCEPCCSDDPQWAEIDRQAAEHAAEYAQFLQEYAIFTARWSRFIDNDLGAIGAHDE